MTLAGALPAALAALNASAQVSVTTTDELTNALATADAGDTVAPAPGIYRLTTPLSPLTGVTRRGTGPAPSVITNDPAAWFVGNAARPDNGIDTATGDTSAYLLSFANATSDVTLDHITCTSDGLHGAIYATFTNTTDTHDTASPAPPTPLPPSPRPRAPRQQATSCKPSDCCAPEIRSLTTPSPRAPSTRSTSSPH